MVLILRTKFERYWYWNFYLPLPKRYLIKCYPADDGNDLQAGQKDVVDKEGGDEESSGKELFAQELKQRTLQKVAKKPQEKKPDPIKRTHEKKCPICNEPFTGKNWANGHGSPLKYFFSTGRRVQSFVCTCVHIFFNLAPYFESCKIRPFYSSSST